MLLLSEDEGNADAGHCVRNGGTEEINHPVDYRISSHLPASRGILLKTSRSVWSRGGQQTQN